MRIRFALLVIAVSSVGLVMQNCIYDTNHSNIEMGEIIDTPYNLSICLNQFINSFEFQQNIEFSTPEIDNSNLCYSISTVSEASDYGLEIHELYFQLSDTFYSCSIEKFVTANEYQEPGQVFPFKNIEFNCGNSHGTDKNHLNLILYNPVKKYDLFFQTIDLSYKGEKFSRMNFIVYNNKIISIL